MWYHEHIGGGRCPIVDTWWQTETGAIMIAPLPGRHHLKPGSATFPLPGIGAEVVDEQGRQGRARAAATSRSPGRGRRCCGASTATPSATKETYWSRFDGPLLRRRRRQDRRRRLPLAARAGRRRDERLGPPRLDHRGGVGARRPPDGGRGGGGRAKDDTTGQAIIAFVTLKGGNEPTPTSSARSCGSTWPRRSAHRPAQDGHLHRRPAQDPQRQDHAPPAARRGRGPRPGRHHHAGRPAVVEEIRERAAGAPED